MIEFLLAVSIFIVLSGAAFVARRISAGPHSRHLGDDTQVVVGRVVGLFVVMASLVFGLLTNSSRAGFDSLADRVQSYAADLILLDRTLAAVGADANPARQLLATYVETAIDDPDRVGHDEILLSHRAEDRLTAVSDAFSTIQPKDDRDAALLDDASGQFLQIIKQRWAIIEAGQRGIPMQMTLMLTAWLVFIFGSFGYRAPRNPVVDATFVTAAALIAGSLYLVLDMNAPFSGPMQISDLPLRQALAELRRNP